jgi:valyl-tRNA synthetase
METDDFKKTFPTPLLETDYDILFSWVARMVMMSLELTARLPFTEVYLHEIIRDADERKMTQTLGNVINPNDFIHDKSSEKLQERFKSSKEDYQDGIPECGTDAQHFALCDSVAKDYLN